MRESQKGHVDLVCHCKGSRCFIVFEVVIVFRLLRPIVRESQKGQKTLVRHCKEPCCFFVYILYQEKSCQKDILSRKAASQNPHPPGVFVKKNVESESKQAQI